MADSKDIVNSLGGTEKTLNDMHAIKEVLKNGGGGSWEREKPIKLGNFEVDGEKYEVYRYIALGNALASNIPKDILAHLDIAWIIDAYGISSESDIQKRVNIYYNGNNRQITFERTNVWITTLYVTYFVRA